MRLQVMRTWAAYFLYASSMMVLSTCVGADTHKVKYWVAERYRFIPVSTMPASGRDATGAREGRQWVQSASGHGEAAE